MKRPSLQLLPLDTQSLNFHYDMAKLLDHLYIGSEDIPSQTSLLRSLKITHVVNVTSTAHYTPGENLEYLQLNCRDDVDEEIINKAEAAFPMIELARSRYVSSSSP